jgi:hypothetical protein
MTKENYLLGEEEEGQDQVENPECDECGQALLPSATWYHCRECQETGDAAYRLCLDCFCDEEKDPHEHSLHLHQAELESRPLCVLPEKDSKHSVILGTWAAAQANSQTRKKYNVRSVLSLLALPNVPTQSSVEPKKVVLKALNASDDSPVSTSKV